MKLAFISKWSEYWQKDFKLPKGFLVIRPEDRYYETVGKALRKLTKRQKREDKLFDLDITIDIHYKKRTLSMNNLMWALYEIEAHELNGGMSGAKDQMITAQRLYEQDVYEYAPVLSARIKEEMLPVLSREYNWYKIKQKDEKTGTVFIDVYISSSHMTTKEHAKWIDRQFNRISYMGVSLDSGADLKDYWFKYREKLNSDKIILYDDIVNKKQYKELQPLCEASGDDLSNGGGEIAHINAIGMGGKEEVEKNYSSNWLHLRTDIHREIIHGQGWEEFVKIYPHLSYKVKTALQREYKPLPEWCKTSNYRDDLF